MGAVTLECSTSMTSSDQLPTNYNFVCEEVVCAAVSMAAPGVIGDDTNGRACIAQHVDGIQLSTINNPSCDVMCQPGYVAQTATLECPLSNAVSGELPTNHNFVCEEVVCAAFDLAP